MQVAALQLFLRSLVPALEAAGEARPAAQWMEEACRALDPFRPLGLAEFTAFLARAEEYERTGTVRVPSAADVRAEELLAAAGRLADGDDLPAAQAEVARVLNELAREAGLKGTVTPDPKWAEARAARARAAPHLEAVRALAVRITGPEAYADEPVRVEVARLEAALDRGTAAAVAAEFGVKAGPRAAPAKVLGDVLAQLSGHAPPRARRGGRSPSPNGEADHGDRDTVARTADGTGGS